MNDFNSLYSQYLKRFLRLTNRVTVVCDVSNGSAGTLIERLQDSKLFLVVLNSKPDGDFPAHGPDPSSLQAVDSLAKEIVRAKADMGILMDADGDRTVFLDEQGTKISVDEMAHLISSSFKPPYITDIRIGQIFEKDKTIKSRVGHYFMKQAMKRKKAEFGAEQSGHYYFKFDFEDGPAYFDCGLRAFIEAVNRLGEIKDHGKTLSGYLRDLPQYFRSGELNYSVSEPARIMREVEQEYKKRRGKVSRLDGITMKFEKEGWWFNLRPSNTEPLLRLNMESSDPKRLKDELLKLSEKITLLDKG